MLRPLFRPSAATGDTSDGLEIIVIPAWGFNEPSQWISPSGSSWLRKLAEDLGPNVSISEYKLDQGHKDSLSDHILNGGTSFLKSLMSHRPKSKSKRPVVFICHGTGGFVLKKALCLCRRFFHEYGYLIPAVSGLIFLGSPHFQRNVPVAEAKQTIEFLCKHRNKEARRTYQTASDASVLIELCQEFERLHLNTPVLSVYESETTATYQSSLFARFLSKTQGQIVVPERLSRLGIPAERFVDGQSNHAGICDIDTGGGVYNALQSFLLDIIRTAPKRIARASIPYTVPMALRGITLRSDAGSLTTDELLAEQASTATSYPEGLATRGSTNGSFDIVPSETPLEESEKEPILPCFMLGSQHRVKHFLGRGDVMATVDGYLLPETKNAPNGEQQGCLHSFAICGLGGMGKTSLAVEYAFSRRHVFDAIFWLSADNASILAANFAQIAKKLGLEDDSSDLAASRSIVMNWLSKPLKRPSEPETQENLAQWLIVFDNVDNLDVLSEFWPGLGRGSVLVTSRDPQAKLNMHIRDGIQLSSLSVGNTLQLLQQLTHSPAIPSQEKAIEALANRLGGLPLAINQIAGIYRQLRCSYTDFVELLDKKGIATTFQTTIDLGKGHESQSLATIWALDRLASPTRALLQVICLLDPDEIPEELLISHPVEQDLPDYPKSRVDYLKARGELLSSSLINLHEESGKLSLHRLIQDTVLHSMNREQLEAAYRAAITLAIAVWPFQSIREHHSIARFSKCEVYFSSVLRLKNGLEPIVREGSFFFKNLGVARLFNDVGWYMFERGLPDETEPFCNVALLIGEQMKGRHSSEAHEAIRESHSFIGIALVETNSHDESRKHKQQWLDMLLERRSESGLPIKDYELGYAYNEIGVAYGNSGMLEKACEAFHESISIFQSLDDYHDTMLGWPEPNLGFMFWLQKDYSRAEEALNEILDIHAAEWGIDDTKSFKTGKILYGLGNVLESQGRFQESLGFHHRCYEQYRKVLGNNHHRLGDACHKMAGHSIREHRFPEAETYIDMALKAFNLRPYLSNEVARTTYLKGRLYHEMGQLEKADEEMRRAFDIRKRLEPTDNRPLEELDETDFDRLVAFWSR